jgi:hypothetical protein
MWDDDPIVAWAGISSNPTVIRASGAAAQVSSGMALSHFNTPFGPVDAADLAWSTLVDIVRGLQVVATANTYLDLGVYYSIRKAFDTAIEPLLNNGRYTDTSEAGLSDVFEWLMAHHSPSKQDIAAALLKDYIIQKRKDTGL